MRFQVPNWQRAVLSMALLALGALMVAIKTLAYR
jgi:hypothetical protein